MSYASRLRAWKNMEHDHLTAPERARVWGLVEAAGWYYDAWLDTGGLAENDPDGAKLVAVLRRYAALMGAETE